MQRRAFVNVVMASVMALGLALAGCSGSGGGTPGPQAVTRSGSFDSSDPQLSDNSFFVTYEVTALSTGTATVTMRSTQANTFVLVFSENPDGTLNSSISVQNRVPSGGNPDDTQVMFDVTQGSKYFVVANTVSGGETGAFTITFSPEIGDPGLRTESNSFFGKAGNKP